MCSFTFLTNDLERWLSNAQKIVIVGVGNPIRLDDNIGAEVVDGLEGRVPKTIILLKSETIPEECIGQIVDLKPTHVLVIDAALLGLRPGSARLNESMESSETALSTHTFPIQIFCQTLVEMTGTKIAMLLIQPKDTGFGEGLTPELDSTKKELIDLIVKITESVLK